MRLTFAHCAGRYANVYAWCGRQCKRWKAAVHTSSVSLVVASVNICDHLVQLRAWIALHMC